MLVGIEGGPVGDQRIDPKKDARTSPVDRSGQSGASPDEFENVVARPGDTPGDTHEVTGSPNQPGLTPSGKQSTQHDRVQEQIQSGSPSDQEESPAEQPEDPNASLGYEYFENEAGRVMDSLDRIQNPDTRSPGEGLSPTSDAEANVGHEPAHEPNTVDADQGVARFDGGADAGGELTDSGFDGGVNAGGGFTDPVFDGGADGGGELTDSGFDGGADGGGEFADSGFDGGADVADAGGDALFE